MDAAIGIAHARAGLLGNPSDVYEGKAIALAIADFSAWARLEAAPRFELVAGPSDAQTFKHFPALMAQLEAVGCDGGLRLMRAALARFGGAWAGWRELADGDPRLRFRMSYGSDIPRQVGLAGSSALVTAALRALMRWFDVTIVPAELAELALAAEVEDLGITAGPMDRVIQAYEGLMVMDFRPPRTAESYRRLDPTLLPPVFVAWDPNPGKVSGKVHGDVRFRWLRGDRDVREAIAVFPKLVEEGVKCLEQGDVRGLMRLVDRNFDTRASIWTLRGRDREMVALGRAAGAAVKFCGSGGAVLGVMENEATFPTLRAAYEAHGYRIIRPTVKNPAPAEAAVR